ncbi:MAG: hypothetical protein J6J70_00265 [Methanocorpusculaceae archaeon]|nr:hypothetical protein [Methanocorpusculaceae archaeon]
MKKTILFLGLFAVLLFGMILPVSAESVTAGDAVYTVSPMAKSSGDYSVMALPQIGVVGSGQTSSYQYSVDSSSTMLNIELSWVLWPLNNELSITIIQPDGTNLGTYHDNYDGNINGVIPLTISSPNSLMEGVWKINVNGKQVQGLQPFTLVINEY